MCISHLFRTFAAKFVAMSEKERIEAIMKSLNLSARQFAEQIHVQPGTISNMMSGRNNPSYDVIKRILIRYPELNPEWLINEQGDMWRTPPGKEAGLFDAQPPEAKRRAEVPQPKEEPQTPAAPPKQIKNIVVYYTDGTYEEFTLTR